MADKTSRERPGTGSGRKFANQEQTVKDCDAIEEELAALRVGYEQYFLGLERKAPLDQHEALKRRVRQLKSSFIRQTALKFRVASIHTTLVTYERLWSRTLKEMEDGTYRRDLFKARLHAKKKKPAAKEAEKAAPPNEDPSFNAPRPTLTFEAVRPGGRTVTFPAVSEGRSASARGAPPSGSAGGVLSDTKLKAIYDAYVKEKKRCNEDVSKLSFETVAATLKKQVPELLKQHRATSVDFKVVVKDGKAVLRAVPRD